MIPSNDGPQACEDALIALAEAQFHNLSGAEKELFKATAQGKKALLFAKEDEPDPIKSTVWARDRVVRGPCLAWLCTDPRATKFVTSRGVEFHCMRIEGDLDLSHATIDFSLRAEQCAFVGSVLLQRTRINGLYFSRCHLSNPDPRRKDFRALDAEGAKIEGGLWLKDRCLIEGEVSLLDTTITAEFDCTSARFTGTQKAGITGDGLKIEGDILLVRCTIGGAVRFLGASIGGDLSCGLSQLFEKEDAFNGDGMKVEGDVLFDEGFHSQGLVSLYAAKIGGSLLCDGGQFFSPGEALLVEESNITGNVSFNGFKAVGRVNLAGAVIGGSFGSDGAEFLNGQDSLMADEMRVEGEMSLGAESKKRDRFRSQGAVRLFGAKIRGNLNCNCAQFLNRGGALYLDGAEIGGDVEFGKVTAEGRVGFAGATIGGDVDFEETFLAKSVADEAENSDPEEQETAFTAEGAKINGTFFFVDGRVDGAISLIGATIGGDLDFRGGTFRAPGKDAINAHRTRIGGDVYFKQGFEAEGSVAFSGAIIGGSVECLQAKFSQPESDALSVDSARIERSVNLHEGLEVDGVLNLQNAEIRRCLDLRGLGTSNSTGLNLQSTRADHVRDDETRWRDGGRLQLDGFIYERFHTEKRVETEGWINWIQRQPRDRFIPQPYEQLAAVLRRMGHERQAKLLMIAKNEDRARFLTARDQGWWWYNVFGRAIGYGYAPWRPFFFSLLIIFVGFVLFSVGANDLISPTKESAYEKDAKGTFLLDPQGNRMISKEYPAFNPLVYSLESFAPLLKFDQSANWAPNANASKTVALGWCSQLTGGILRGYLYCHIIMGWLLTSLWIGSVTGLVKT